MESGVTACSGRVQVTLQAHTGVSTHSRVWVFSVVCRKVLTQRAVPVGWQEFLGMHHPSPGTIRSCLSESQPLLLPSCAGG